MKRILVIGLGIWLAATVVLRLWGQWLLRPADGASMLLLFAVSVPVMLWLPRRLLRRPRLAAADWAAAGIALVMPGMLLDALATLQFHRLYPNLQADAAPLFAAWILVCNAVALASVYIAARSAPASGA